MTELIACVSTGKGTWSEVSQLLKAEEWDNVFIITTEFGKERFSAKAEYVLVGENMPVTMMIQAIVDQLKSKVRGTEVALNIASGSGKEHMAILSAMLQLGVGIRLVSMTEKGMVFL